MEYEEKTTSRPRFLRQVAVTLAAAVGAGTFASRAWSAPGDCCYNNCQCGSQLPSGTCPQGQCFCFCDCTGISSSYCWDTLGACRSSGCQPCPC